MIIKTFLIFLFGLLLPATALAQERIVGGQPGSLDLTRVAIVAANDNSYDGYFCGGTLVRPRWVLTAAHCIDQARTDVVVGRRNLQIRDGQRIAVVAKRVHPLFKLSSLRYDQALLRLSQAPKKFRTAALGTAQPGQSGLVSGWGYTLDSRPAVIHSAPMTILPYADCQWNFGSFFDQQTMFCARGQEQQNICQGDSGSGFLTSSKVIGVVSWSPTGCQKYPDGYARIDSNWSAKVFAENRKWPVRKAIDRPYTQLPPLISSFFAVEEINGEQSADIKFYSNYSLSQATVVIQGSSFCIPPGCTGNSLNLNSAVGRREWSGKIRFRGCVNLSFRGRVAEGKYNGQWATTKEQLCS